MIKPRPPRLISTRLVPSAVTVLAMCLGLTAVKFALDQRPTESMALLAAAAILDALDGRIARLLKATSRMGEEIDSLADAVNFGVAPAFIVYSLLLSHSRIGWIVVLLYAVCIVLRLARFNALLDADLPAYTKEYFVGMPAPAGAIGAIGPLAARMQWPGEWWTTQTAESIIIAWMVGVSLLVVSRIPMRKVHTFAVKPNMVAPLLAMLAIGTAAAFVFPYLVILLIIAATSSTSRSRCARSAGSPRTRRPGTIGRASSAPRAGRSDAPSTRGAARWPGSACVSRGAERCPTPRSPTPPRRCRG